MKKKEILRMFAAPAALSALLMSTIPVSAQELIPVNDVTGGSSVFVLRSTSPRKFVGSRARRTKSERIATAKRVTKQYTALAKVNPRRDRTTSVDPTDSRLKDIPRMDPVAASKLFAGVGEYYMDRDDYNHAIDFFRESVTMDSKNSSAASGLSEALALKGNDLLVKDSFPIAKSFFEEALKYNAKNAPAYFGLAEVLTEMKKDDEAMSNYENALSNDNQLSEIYTPLGALYYQKGEIAKADEYLTKAVADSPSDPQAQYFYGLVKLSQNDNQAALAALLKSESLDATNGDVFYYAGEAQMRLKQPDKALAEYTRATEIKPDSFEAWMGRGNADYALGNYAEAVKDFTRATKLKNDNFVAYNNLGDAYRKIPDFNKAEANYNLAATFIKREPNYNKDDAADMYSKAAFSIAKQCEINITKSFPCRWDAAVRALESANQISGGGVDAANLGWAYYNAARADMANGKTAEARPKLEQAKLNLEKVANSNANFVSGPMLNLGMALTDLGEYDAAIDVLKKVVAKEPKWVFAINELGVAYRKKGDFKGAAQQFEKAIDKDSKFAAAYFNLGEAQFRGGNLKEARKAWDALKKMGRLDLAAQLDVVTNGGLRSGS